MKPDYALMFDTEEGLQSPSEKLVPLLSRHGIWRSNQLVSYFREWCGRVVRIGKASGADSSHQYWPSRNGGIYLAILPWQGESSYVIHFYEEPAPTSDQKLLAQLTPREMEVLSWVANGKDNASIAVRSSLGSFSGALQLVSIVWDQGWFIGKLCLHSCHALKVNLLGHR
ncbi:MAG: hypothetical protein JXR25_10025 [Pontiellaceae bacterium]|nr:hypothetical protein [Pontiellaceae bacterium]MBN2785155.1 hypothetical protein [Pontiellaceae bacterium]